MNEVTIYRNEEFGAVRAVEREGEPWFVAADVCRALGIGNSSDAVKRLDDDEHALVSIEGLSRGNDKANIVNEPGLYGLVLASRKPEAKAFKRWITHEVIPAIRKTGGYIAAKSDETPEEIMARALVVAQDTLARHKKQLEEANSKIALDAPKVFFAETVQKAESDILIRDLAKLLRQKGLDIGEKRLFELLRKDSYLISAKGRDYNSPTQKSMDMGLMRIAERTHATSEGTFISKTPMITGKGQVYFINRYAPKGEGAVQETMKIE